MKKLKDIEAEQNKISSEISELEKQLKKLNEKLGKLANGWKFKCKKCGLAFRPNEIGYRDWEVRRTKMDCQPMGEYDIWQVVEKQHIACCPKCGKDFGVKAYYSDCISSTPRYSRWDDKPEMAECYKKLVDKKIHKVDKTMVKYMKQTHYFD